MGGFNIPLEGVAPQVKSPMDLLQQRAGMQNLATSVQLNQVRLKEEQQKQQELEQDKEDNNAIQREFLNPDHLKPSQDDPSHRTMDWDSLRGSLQGKIRLRNLQKLDADHQQQLRSAQELAATDKMNQTNTLALKDAQNKVIGREIQALEGLDDKDKPAYYAGALQRLQKQNIDVSDLPPTIPGDGSFNQQLQAIAATHGYNGAILSDTLKKQKAEQAEALAKKTTKQAQAVEDKDTEDQKQRARENIARMYLAADPQTAEEHLALIDQIDQKYPALRAEYDAIRFNPDKTARTIQDMALPAEKRMLAGQRDVAEEDRRISQQENRDTRSLIAMQTADMRRELAASRGKADGQTSNSRAVDRRQDTRDLNKLAEEEEQAAAVRASLETALASGGKLYVDEKGKKIPMDTATRQSEENAESLTSGMKTQYQTLTNRLKRITAEKNQIGERLGMQIGVTTDQIHSALDADVQRVLGTGGKKPAKEAQQSTAPAQKAAPNSTGPATPPAAIAAKVKEGQTIESPDGERWQKVKGQMVLLPKKPKA